MGSKSVQSSRGCCRCCCCWSGDPTLKTTGWDPDCLWLCCPFSAAQLQADAVTLTWGKRSHVLGLCAGAALPQAGGKLEATGHCLALLASRRHFRHPTLQIGQPFPMGAPAIPGNAWARGINGVI